MRRLVSISALFVFLLFPSFGLSAQSWMFSDYKEIVDSLESYGIPNQRTRAILFSSRLEYYPNIMNRFEVDPAPNSNPYRRFLRSRSVRSGKEFIRENNDLLDRAEKEFGVPKEVFAAFLRVESNFGEHTGNYQAVGVFASVLKYGGSDTVRIEWAKDELISLIRLAEESNRNIFEFNSSYAGAFGLPQFMPTSFLNFAADGDGDGEIDLYNTEDAVWSIGSYLVNHGWHVDRRRAIFEYNHSNNFVDCIMEYADLVGK